MKDRYLDLRIGQGLGPFALGMSLFECWKLAGSADAIRFLVASPQLEIMQLLDYDVNLHFDKDMQRLVMIEVRLDGAGNACVAYRRELIKKLDFNSIYNRIFGPTYPGSNRDNDYYLSYDGLVFRFDGLDSLFDLSVDKNQLIQNMNTCHQEIECSTIYIVSNGGVSHLEYLAQMDSVLVSGDPIRKLECFDAALAAAGHLNRSLSPNPQLSGGKSTVEIRLAISYANINEGLLKLQFNSHPLNLDDFLITIGLTNLQEAIKVLGEPNDSMITKSGLLVHNYFSFGLDIFYISSSSGISIIDKIILHNNCLQSMEFMKYKRHDVIFTNELTSNNYHKINDFDSATDVTNFMNWDSIKSMLNLNPIKDPIFLNRKSYDINDDFTHLDDFSDNKSKVPPNLDLDKWSLSKLIVTKNSIFEIMVNDNQTVSNVTMLSS